MTTSEPLADEALSAKHEELRRWHLPAERELRSLGSRYIFIGALLGIGYWSVSNRYFTLAMSTGDTVWDLSNQPLVAAGLWSASSALSVVGWGLRNHQSWSRLPAIFLAVVGAIAALAGIAITWWTLALSYVCISAAYSLTNERMARVLSDEYGAAVRATPQLSPKSYAWASGAMSVLFVLALVSWLMPDDQRAPGASAADETASARAQLGAWEEACVHGDAVACHNAAVAYDVEQEGMERDVSRAMALFERACAAGHGMSCANLGTFFALGEDVELDLAQAEALFVRACDDGVQEGCTNLRVLHRQSTARSAKE